MSLALRFSKNLSFLLVARAFSILANIVFLVVCTRHLGVAAFGTLVFILALTSFLELLFTGSVDTVLVREHATSPESVQSHFHSALFLQSCFSFVLLLSSFGSAFHFRNDPILAWGLILAGIASCFQILVSIPIAFYRSEENMKFEATLITVERTVFLLGFLIAVWLGAGIIVIVSCLVVSVALKVSLGFRWFLRRRSVSLWPPDTHLVRYLLRESWPLMVTMGLVALKWRVDLFILKGLSNSYGVGLYGACFRLLEMLRVLPIDVISAAFPILCKLATTDKLQRGYEGLIKASLVGSVFVGALGAVYPERLTIFLFGEQYHPAVDALRVLVVVFPLMFLTQLNNVTLVAVRRQGAYTRCLLIAVAGQLVLDLSLIPIWGALGAAVAFAGGELILWISTLVALAPLALRVRITLGIALRFGLAMGVALLLTKLASPASLPVASVLTLLAYCLGLWLLRVISPQDLKTFQTLLSPNVSLLSDERPILR